MRRMIVGLAMVACLSLACSGFVNVKQFTGPDGHLVWHLKSWDKSAVLEEAGDLCPRGYHVVSANVHGGQYYLLPAFGGGLVAGQSKDYELMIKCRSRAVNAQQSSEPARVLDCRNSDWCRQLGRCRTVNGKCVR